MRIVLTSRTHERLNSAVGLVSPWAGRAGTDNVRPISLSTFLPEAIKSTFVSAGSAQLNVALRNALGHSDSPNLIFVSVGLQSPSIFFPRFAQCLGLISRLERASFWRAVDAFDIALELHHAGLAFGPAPLDLSVLPKDPALARDGYGYPTHLLLAAILNRQVEVVAASERAISAVSLTLTCRALLPAASATAGQSIPVQSLAVSVRALQPEARRDGSAVASASPLSLSVAMTSPEIRRLDQATAHVVPLMLTASLYQPGLDRFGEARSSVMPLMLTASLYQPELDRLGEALVGVVPLALSISLGRPDRVATLPSEVAATAFGLAIQLRPAQLVHLRDQSQFVQPIVLAVAPWLPAVQRLEPASIRALVASVVLSMRQPSFVRDLGQWNAYAQPISLRLAPLVPSPAFQSDTTISKVAPSIRLTVSVQVYAGYGFALPAGALPSDLLE